MEPVFCLCACCVLPRFHRDTGNWAQEMDEPLSNYHHNAATSYHFYLTHHATQTAKRSIRYKTPRSICCSLRGALVWVRACVQQKSNGWQTILRMKCPCLQKGQDFWTATQICKTLNHRDFSVSLLVIATFAPVCVLATRGIDKSAGVKFWNSFWGMHAILHTPMPRL